MAVIKVIVADDEHVVADILAKKLRDAGYESYAVYDGQAAWDAICQQLPDVVVLDLNMPHMTGWEVLEKLRSNPPVKRWIPVIIVSALQDLDNIQRTMSLEADHYLTKPCKTEDVVKSIRLMLDLAAHRSL